MFKKTLATLAALALVAFISPVNATHSEECPAETIYIPPFAENPPADVPGMYPYYVAYDHVTAEIDGSVGFSVWVYEESNGVNGIQRDDDFCFNGPYTQGKDTDTIIF